MDEEAEVVGGEEEAGEAEEAKEAGVCCEDRVYEGGIFKRGVS